MSDTTMSAKNLGKWRDKYQLALCTILCLASGYLSGILFLPFFGFFLPGVMFGLAWGVAVFRSVGRILAFSVVSGIIYFLAYEIAVSGIYSGREVSFYLASLFGAVMLSLVCYLINRIEIDWVIVLVIGLIALACTPTMHMGNSPMALFIVWQTVVGVALTSLTVRKTQANKIGSTSVVESILEER